MKLKIVNLHEGLLDNKTHRVVPTNRQVCVDDSAFWRRRCEQGHCQLIERLTDEQWAKEVREQFEAEAAPKPTRRRGRRRITKKTDATTAAPTSESEG